MVYFVSSTEQVLRAIRQRALDSKAISSNTRLSERTVRYALERLLKDNRAQIVCGLGDMRQRRYKGVDDDSQ